jgi:hypothetical protein
MNSSISLNEIFVKLNWIYWIEPPNLKLNYYAKTSHLGVLAYALNDNYFCYLWIHMIA